ncbi:Auxin-responsive protein IAA32, partial [Mucuna pruriens]
MDSNTSSFLLNSSTLHSVFYQDKQDDGIIDLGLSLGTVQHEAYNSSGNCMGSPLLHSFNSSSLLIFHTPFMYDDDLLDWPHSNLNLKNSSTMPSRSVHKNFDEETEGVQSNERWAYVKVNMDGVTIGRKICVLDHGGYSSLAHQLENMFGRQRSQSVSGLRLFQSGSDYSLFYKDRQDNWRVVGDVPWKEFIECVRRLRIARKNVGSVSCSSRYT